MRKPCKTNVCQYIIRTTTSIYSKTKKEINKHICIYLKLYAIGLSLLYLYRWFF